MREQFGNNAAFQFTLPHGERPKAGREATETAQFQFTLPHGERPITPAQEAKPARFQFTLPHGERRECQSWAAIGHRVSIHAPAWGATHHAVAGFDRPHVSIHAPAWGATPCRWPGRGGWPRFNSRSRMGSDPQPRRRRFHPLRFNSRSRMGSDAWTVRTVSRRPCFNSRSRMGSDNRHHLEPGLVKVSIHAPAWGATRSAYWGIRGAPVSIHAPAWGATYLQRN